MKETITLSNEYWIKIVGFLQHNWALIEVSDNNTATILFIHDGAVVFDLINYNSIESAESALLKNGFNQYLNKKFNFTQLASPPQKPYSYSLRPIYSSGEFWNL